MIRGCGFSLLIGVYCFFVSLGAGTGIAQIIPYLRIGWVYLYGLSVCLYCFLETPQRIIHEGQINLGVKIIRFNSDYFLVCFHRLFVSV